MFYIAICDDEPAFVELLRDDLCKVMAECGSERHQIDEYTDPGHLLRQVEAGRKYHILYLDIMMGEDSGIEAARQLRDAHEANASIIFVSSNPGLASKTFPMKPDDFLTKPVELKELRRATLSSLKKWEEDATITLVDVEMNVHVVRYGKISYVEHYRKQLVFHCGEADRQIICTADMVDVDKALPNPRFYRCHRSFIVNIGQVERIGRDKLALKSGVTIPISRRRYSDTLRTYVKQREVTP